MTPIRDRKRILIFSLAYYPRFIGGAEIAVKEITDRISDEEYVFDMITLRKHADAFERIGNVNVYRVGFPWRGKRTSSSRIFPLSKYLYIFFALAKAVELNRHHRYDAVWAIMAAYAGLAALFFKFLYPRIPFLLTLQEGDLFPDIRRRSVRAAYALFRMIFTRANHIQAISRYLAGWARSMEAHAPITIIPNGVDIAHFTHAPPGINAVTHTPPGVNAAKGMKREEGDVLLITTSRLVPKNAVDDIIRSLEFLPQRTKLFVVGVGYEEKKLKEIAQKKNLSRRVEFLGFIPHKELPAYLHAADIFIRPSRSEGMGNSFIEAMAAGVPVVATPVGGIVDFLKDGETGIFCGVNDPKSIASAVARLMENDELRERIIKNAKKLAIGSYSWELIAQDMKNKVFENLFKQ